MQDSIADRSATLSVFSLHSDNDDPHAFDEAPAPYLVTDGFSAVMAVNAKAQELFGINASAFHGKPLTSLAEASSLRVLVRKLADLRRGKISEISGLPLRLSKRSFNYVDVLASVIKEKSPQGMRLRWILTDVTEYNKNKDIAETRNEEFAKRLDSLRAAYDEAVRASRFKSEFVANVSHEIRTPLNGVIAMCDLLESTDLNEEQDEYISLLSTSARILKDLVADVLNVSKIESGTLELLQEPFDIIECVESAASVVQEQALAKSLPIELIVSKQVPRWIVGDRARLRQVILNLLVNAVKFTEKGEVLCSLSVLQDSMDTVASARSGPMLRIEVRDTGIGIDEHAISLLFQPFTQANSAIGTKYGGSGLGLYISRRLIELMGGTISVHSSKGQGSSFVVTIPLVVAEEEQPPTAWPRNWLSNSGLQGKVLIVDDSQVNRKVEFLLVKKMGMEGFTAASAGEALAILEAAAFDVVLMDCQMPGMDGFEAARLIREREAAQGKPPMKIVAVTGLALEDDRRRCYEAGMDAYITKPIDPAHLGEVIRKMMNNDVRRD
jgi:signal transduction histidine kinase/ActR/RegA family two-component response regulator